VGCKALTLREIRFDGRKEEDAHSNNPKPAAMPASADPLSPDTDNFL
jgi:hypothetical protein